MKKVLLQDMQTKYIVKKAIICLGSPLASQASGKQPKHHYQL